MQLNEAKYQKTRRLLSLAVGLLTILPLAPLINRYIPPIIIGSWNFDLLVAILMAGLFTYLIIRIFRFLIIPAVILLLLVVIYSQFFAGYGIASIVHDYQSLVKNNWGRKEEKQIAFVFTPSFFDAPLNRTVNQLKSKITPTDSLVRNFAVEHSLENFRDYYPKYGNITRIFSLFKFINARFQYVPDARRDEYFASARETILNGLGGDCDDHTILMVSAIEAIGGRARMVLTEGHLYPELYCGDKTEFEKVQQAIIHLFGNEKINNIYFRENNGEYWLNLDYSARHPGGPYVSDKVFAIIER
mgnify:CR=1 FL=1